MTEAGRPAARWEAELLAEVARQADILHGQNAACVIKGINEGTIGRGFQKLSLIEGCVVVADPGVVPPERCHEIVALPVP